jgi:predicted nucleic acid-binding protein
MGELLVQPYRNANQDQVNQFYGLLTTYPHLEWIAPDLEIADLAARFRAEYRLRLPDALHAATAAGRRATGFVTNDPVFSRVDAFETLVLEELLC